MSTITAKFRIFIEDGFYEEVMRYTERDSIEDITDEDIKCYLEDSMDKARTNSEYFMIEGGDTDGWFIDGIEK